jgi:hypothetical protein
LDSDLHFREEEDEAFFARVAHYLSFIGGIVIRRDIWMQRERPRYYGSLFIHVGVIFQGPAVGYVKVLARPLVVIRYGNAMWTARGFEIWTFMWPELLWSFERYSVAARRSATVREPWRKVGHLLLQRAIGGYAMSEFHKHLAERARGWCRLQAWLVARCPGGFANFIALAYLGAFRRQARVGIYDLLRSRYVNAASRFLGRLLSV